MKRINPFILSGVLLIFAAAVLCIFNLRTEKSAGVLSEAVLTELEETEPETKTVFSREEAAFLPPEEIEYPDYVLNPEMELPLVTVGDFDYCGTVSLPTLGIELPVIHEWTYPGLRVAPCRYEGTPYLNNMILCAHNYSTHFGEIKNLSVGDEVSFTDNQGNVFLYRVTEIEKLGPWDSVRMIEGNYGLTLFTCTIGGKSRVTVRCEKAA